MRKIKSVAFYSFAAVVAICAALYGSALQSEVEFYRSHESQWNRACEDLRAQVHALQERNDELRRDLDNVDFAIAKLTHLRKSATQGRATYRPLGDVLGPDGKITWSALSR